MKILDMSAGNRAVWFDKNYRDAVYIDIRPEMEPTLVADTRNLPPEVGSGYDLVVFDPPLWKMFPFITVKRYKAGWALEAARFFPGRRGVNMSKTQRWKIKKAYKFFHKGRFRN